VAGLRQRGVDARFQDLGAQCVFGCLVGGQLVVDTPDAVRLAVQQQGVAGVPVRVEKGLPLGGQGQVDADVGDHELPFVGGALEPQLQQAADARARAVAGHKPLRFLRVGPGRGVHPRLQPVGLLREADEFVAPAQLDQRFGQHRVDQVFLQVLLLQVDHGKEAVVRIVRRFHAEDTLAAVPGVAKAPGQAVCRDALCHTDLLQDLHRAPREDDGAAAFRHLALGFQQHAGHTVACQFQCRRQAHRAGTGDQHGRGPGRVRAW